MGNAAIYNPYLDTLGGGERYTLTFAKVLTELGFVVDIEWKDASILNKLSQRFGLHISKKINVVNDIKRGDGYDIVFYISDGSIPLLKASKNFIHFQVPFRNVNGNSLINKMKLFRVDSVICNSNFTKKIIDHEFGVKSVVVYPPVATDLYKAKRKINQICFVSRFSNLIQNKGHDVLINQFRELVKDSRFSKWNMIFAGGSEVGSSENINKLKCMAEGLNISFVENPNIEKLKKIFGESKVFWSASGYGFDEHESPEKSEHFGISLVEAMSAGCIPVVYNSGGYKEIIDNGKNGFLWNNQSELLGITKSIYDTPRLYLEISKSSIVSSKKYSYEEFKNSIVKIL